MWYSPIFEEPFHGIYLKITTAISMASNLLLLFTLVRSKGTTLGGYKFLLAFFAFCDASLSLGHLLIQPMAYISSTGLNYFNLVGAENPSPNGELGFIYCQLFIVCFYQTFVLLMFHFVYRFQALTGSFGPLSSDRPVSMVASGIVFNFFYIASIVIGAFGSRDNEFTRSQIPPEANQAFSNVNFTADNMGYLNILYWEVDMETGEVTGFHYQALVTVVIIVSFVAVSACIVIGCALGIVKRLKSATLSDRTKELQRHLFRALLIQTSIPCIFSYLPLSMIMIFPFFRIQIGPTGSILLMITAIFPASDALFIIAFIAPLRAVIFGVKERKTAPSTTDGAMTTVVI